jgi:hypothetical protein
LIHVGDLGAQHPQHSIQLFLFAYILGLGADRMPKTG